MNKGLMVSDVTPASPAFRAGLRKGDRIVAINAEAVTDELEICFFAAQPVLELLYFRRGVLHEGYGMRRGGEPLGLTVIRPPIRRCANRCVFCFVDQMPKGLRASLYVKDEDYRYSFTNGNYITLSRTPPEDIARIIELGLSPLYVSVHATDRAVRNRLLGISSGYPILNQLRLLADNNIQFHTQIVVCPGINDAAVLTQTVSDLLSVGDSLLSIAVVPVGLTRYRTAPLAPVTQAIAAEICRAVGAVSDARVKQDGRRRVFCADEMFIKADLPIPPKKYYEDYPQIENGVGLIRGLLEEWRVLKKTLATCARPAVSAQRGATAGIAIVTAQSAAPFIRRIMAGLQALHPGVSIQVIPVVNTFFGETVTVTGLLTAADVIAAVRAESPRFKRVLLPGVMFNASGHTLDGYSVKRIERCIGAPARVVETLREVEGYVAGKK